MVNPDIPHNEGMVEPIEIVIEGRILPGEVDQTPAADLDHLGEARRVPEPRRVVLAQQEVGHVIAHADDPALSLGGTLLRWADAGWRIDYHLATPALAANAANYKVHRAASYDTRFTDHSPVSVEYAL